MNLNDINEFLKIIISNKITRPTKIGAALIIIFSFLYYCLVWIDEGFPNPVTPINFVCVAFVFFISALITSHWQKTQRFPSKKYKSLQRK